MSNQDKVHSLEEVSQVLEKTNMTKSEFDEIMGICNISSIEEFTKE